MVTHYDAYGTLLFVYLKVEWGDFVSTFKNIEKIVVLFEPLDRRPALRLFLGLNFNMGLPFFPCRVPAASCSQQKEVNSRLARVHMFVILFILSFVIVYFN